MKLPAGEHEIVFEFKPVVYALGENLSLMGMIIYILLLIGAIAWAFKDKFSKKELSST